jgi:uncharacterized MnhB-related membrane protein
MPMSIFVGSWRFGADDPTVLGWVTTVTYFLAAFLCLRAAFIAPKNFGAFGLATQPWWLFACILIALGVNKELDLQTLLIDVMRSLAKTEGWYSERRIVERAFVMLVILVSALAGWQFVRQYRLFVCKNISTVTGLGMVLLYCLLRTADVAHLEVLGSNHTSSNFLWPLELSGLALVCFGSAKMAIAPLLP